MGRRREMRTPYTRTHTYQNILGIGTPVPFLFFFFVFVFNTRHSDATNDATLFLSQGFRKRPQENALSICKNKTRHKRGKKKKKRCEYVQLHMIHSHDRSVQRSLPLYTAYTAARLAWTVKKKNDHIKAGSVGVLLKNSEKFNASPRCLRLFLVEAVSPVSPISSSFRSSVAFGVWLFSCLLHVSYVSFLILQCPPKRQRKKKRHRKSW